MKPRILLTSLVIASSPAWSQGTPWLSSPGSTDLSISYVNQSADEFYLGEDKATIPNGELTQDTLWINASHVLSDNLAINARIGYAESENDVTEDSGLADSTFGLIWRLNDEFIEPGLPSIALQFALTLAGDYEENRLESIGDGANAFEASLILGKAITSRLALSGEIGYRYRDSDVEDELLFNLGSYWQWDSQISSSLSFYWVDAQGDLDIGDPGFNGNFTDVSEDNQILDLGIISYRWNSGINLGLNYAQVLDGRNTAESDIVAVTLGYSF